VHTTATRASLQAKHTRYRRAHGGTATTTPERAATHIAGLRREGMTDLEIRAAARVGVATFYRAVGEQGPITRTSERRILTVTPPTARTAPCSTAGVPPHGTRRRLQALVHAGWPPPVLAAALGRHVQHVHELLHRERDQVSLRVEAAVRALFAELWDQQPEQHGVRPAAATRARALATRHSWHSDVVWDNLDDPNAQPQYGTETSRQQAVIEDTAELVLEGLSREGIAARLGIQWDAIRQAHRRAGVDVPLIHE
jgi:hypothetical protein